MANSIKRAIEVKGNKYGNLDAPFVVAVNYVSATNLQPDLQPLDGTGPYWLAFEFGLNTIGTN